MDLCLTALTEATQQVITKHKVLVLSARERSFFEALTRPPKPSQRLRQAFKKGGCSSRRDVRASGVLVNASNC
jgi:uncharacterized protein (DUF1778 family)